jgi:hypothetical protein
VKPVRFYTTDDRASLLSSGQSLNSTKKNVSNILPGLTYCVNIPLFHQLEIKSSFIHLVFKPEFKNGGCHENIAIIIRNGALCLISSIFISSNSNFTLIKIFAGNKVRG